MNISVALCTCNGESYLYEQLHSIASQSIRPNELIISDDCSTDSTCQIVRDFSELTDFSVKLLRNKARLGVVQNFEQAIKHCQGEIIVLSDQDDVWMFNKLERIIAEFTASPDVNMVFSNADRVDEELNKLVEDLWSVVEFSPSEQVMARAGRLNEVLLRHYAVTGATMAFRSDLREIVLPIPEGWMHDAWIALMASSFGETSVIDDRLILYRQHASNQIGARRKSWRERWHESLKTRRGAYYGKELQRYQDALSRLNQYSHRLRDRKPIHLVENKIQFLGVRRSLASSRWLRLPVILREMCLMNYRNYSSGWLVGIKDLILPNDSKQ